MMTSRFERKELEKLFFYIDILVAGIFAIALVMLVKDAYTAGFWDAQQDAYKQGVNSWYMMRDAAFVVVSLGWLLYRHFRGKIQQFVNPWA